ncbi:MAG TPA: hypothetical protein VK878_25215 [Candidatus Deferrimicrobiaceae bacterium]|nr:hypothetical protein [Candidatus Deferrimicrobiaceae bacterium]
MDRATRAMLPFVAVLLIGLLIIVLVPQITLILPLQAALRRRALTPPRGSAA